MQYVEPRGNIFYWCLSVRYVFAISASIGMAIIYILRTNINILMMSMVNHTVIEERDYYFQMEDGPLHWTRFQQSLILSSYYWGFILLHIIGTFVVKRYSAKWIIFFAVVINIVANLLIPYMTTINYSAVIGMRVIQGFSASIMFPSMHILLFNWSPQYELGMMCKVVYTGMGLGSMISILCSGLLSYYVGWEFAFYILGVVCIPWCIFWAWFIHDSPNEQIYISLSERLYIIKHTKDYRKIKRKTPWKSIVTSRPFYAIIIAHFFNNWGWCLFLIEMPFYISSVLRINLPMIAVLSSIPHILVWIFHVIYSIFIMNFLLKGQVSLVNLRKISTAMGGLIPALCLCIINSVDHNPYISILMFYISMAFLGSVFSGYLTNHMDIAPRFINVLMAITNTISQIPGILIPIFVGFITEITDAKLAWTIIFYVTTGMYSIGVIFYTFLASANIQNWNRDKYENDEEDFDAMDHSLRTYLRRQFESTTSL